MQKNIIFEGAKFGDRYRTRDGRLAIFVYDHVRSGYLLFAVEGTVNIQEYTRDGVFHNWDSSPESGWTIVSKDYPGADYELKRVKGRVREKLSYWIMSHLAQIK